MTAATEVKNTRGDLDNLDELDDFGGLAQTPAPDLGTKR